MTTEVHSSTFGVSTASKYQEIPTREQQSSNAKGNSLTTQAEANQS